MPLVGFKCPSNGEEPGRENSFDYCLTQCSNRCMPKAILAVSREQNVGNVHKGEMITPSGLGGCPRKLVLERTSDYHEEPPKLYYAVRGSLIHGFLESPNLERVHTEQRLYKTVKIDNRELVISGQLDCYDGNEEKIEDYKTLSDKGTFFLFDTGAKEEHILQTNVYRWLCDGGRLGSLDGPEVHWPVRSIQINYLFMNRVVMTGSTYHERVTTYKSPNNGKKYRLETKREVVDESPRGVPIWQITLEIPPVPILPEGKIMAHLELAALGLKAGFEARKSGEYPPGVLYDKESAWQCGFCPVQDLCHAYEKQVNPDKFNNR